METFWSILVWSFSAMAKGRWPRTDHRGMAFEPGSKGARMANKFLAGGFKGILLQMAGDLDYMTKHLQTPRSTNHEKPCVLCRCKQFGPCSWLDNRPNSLWQRSTVKASNYRTHWDPQGPLYTLPGLSNMSLAMDYMHCMHLGWLQYFYGSVLYVLAFSLLPEEPTANLLALGHMIKEHQKRHDAKHRYRMRLDKVTMIKPKKVFPSFVVEQQTFLEWHTACMICGCNSWMVATSSTNRFDFFEIELGIEGFAGHFQPHLWLLCHTIH